MHIVTPCIESTPLSQRRGFPVWLKLENTQPAGSFKQRGMGAAARAAVEAGAQRLVSSSGGNAGLAVAWAGRALGVPVTVVVPSRTSEGMKARIAAQGADVQVHGEVWDDAHARAIELAEHGGALMHPFDHPDIWEGHSTLIDELPHEPKALVVSVGGGGLLAGVLMGLQRRDWSTRVYAVETFGTDSLFRAMEAGRVVDRGGVDGIALTLGARAVAQECLVRSLDWGVQPLRVSDRQAVDACARFADDHRMLVEPACGAALAGLDQVQAEDALVVVCGGASATPADLATWMATTG